MKNGKTVRGRNEGIHEEVTKGLKVRGRWDWKAGKKSNNLAFLSANTTGI